jgi:hypothetical protein
MLHPDNEILNLPWTMAVDSISNQQIGAIQRLYLTKGLPGCTEVREALKTPPPLKILIMISSPEDAGWRSQLSYEDEELEILKAFQPLMQTGEVEIDFTDDGSPSRHSSGRAPGIDTTSFISQATGISEMGKGISSSKIP